MLQTECLCPSKICIVKPNLQCVLGSGAVGGDLALFELTQAI